MFLREFVFIFYAHDKCGYSANTHTHTHTHTSGAPLMSMAAYKDFPSHGWHEDRCAFVCVCLSTCVCVCVCV